MPTILSIVALAIAATFTAVLWRAVGVVSRRIEQPQPLADPVVSHDELTFLHKGVAQNEAAIAKLVLAVSDGIERVHRAETRVAKTVTNARRLVRNAGLEHEGLEAEHEEIRARDENGIEPLPTLPEEVAQTRTIRIPGGSLTIGAAS